MSCPLMNLINFMGYKCFKQRMVYCAKKYLQENWQLSNKIKWRNYTTCCTFLFFLVFACSSLFSSYVILSSDFGSYAPFSCWLLIFCYFYNSATIYGGLCLNLRIFFIFDANTSTENSGGQMRFHNYGK